MPNDYDTARKARGTPKTSMTIEAAPGLPAPVEAPKASEPKPKDKTPLLNAPNTYDRNTYTPEMQIYKPQQSRA